MGSLQQGVGRREARASTECAAYLGLERPVTTTGQRALQWRLSFAFSPVSEIIKLEQIKLYAYRPLAFLKQFLGCQNLQWNLLLVTKPQAIADSVSRLVTRCRFKFGVKAAVT